MLANEKNDLLYLLNILEYIGKVFDIEEVKISKESQYYKYIKFENIVE